MERLPQEILTVIAEYVEHEYVYTIVDLACTCKHLYYRLAPLLFRTLRFSAHDFTQLAEDVHQTRQILQRVDGYGHVRRLIIDDKARRSRKHDEARFGSQEQTRQPLWHRPKMSLVEFSSHFDDILEGCMRELHTKRNDTMSLEAVYETNHSWEPLTDLLKQVTSLECLFFDCRHQLPPCLLQCLRQNQHQCRLYINRFILRSLDVHGTDDYEYTLASSPCLYGLSISCVVLDITLPSPWYDDEALECIVGGLAPNLKRLCMARTLGRPTAVRSDPTVPWAGFAQRTFESKGTKLRGALKNFSLSNWPILRKEELAKWQSITDCSALTTLRMDVGCFAIASPEHLAARCSFPSLEELDIDLGPARNNRRYHPNCVDAINSFMVHLPALSNLRLTGWHPRISVAKILDKNGSRLRHLSLTSFNGRTLSLENLHQLVETCQVLETLTIQIKRSRGSYEEYTYYQTLGLLPRLRHLNLELETSKSLRDDHTSEEDLQPSSDPSFSEFDERLSSVKIMPGRFARNGHVRDNFINSTLDKKLAYDIYKAICSSRDKEGDNRFVPLASMKVSVTGAFQLGQHQHYKTPRSISGVVNYLSRPCYVKRVIGSDGNAMVVVEQEPSPEVLKTDPGRENLRLDPQIDAVYERVWPAKSSHWWENWHSFPLAKSVDEEIDWKSR